MTTLFHYMKGRFGPIKPISSCHFLLQARKVSGRGIDFISVSTICRLYFGIVPTVWYFYTPRKHSLGGYIGIALPVRLSGPTSTSFVQFPPNFVEFKIMMCELCSIKDCIVHWVLLLLCLFGLRNFETIQYALCHCKFSYMINQKFMKFCTL